MEEEDEILFQNTNLRPKRISLDTNNNDRGKLLNLKLEQQGLYILNGRTPGDIPGCHTFIRGQSKTVIDYFCTNAGNLDQINKLKILDSTAGADHFPIELTMTVKGDLHNIPERKTIQKTSGLKWKEDEKENYQHEIIDWTQNIATSNENGNELSRKLQKKIKHTAVL